MHLWKLGAFAPMAMLTLAACFDGSPSDDDFLEGDLDGDDDTGDTDESGPSTSTRDGPSSA